MRGRLLCNGIQNAKSKNKNKKIKAYLLQFLSNAEYHEHFQYNGDNSKWLPLIIIPNFGFLLF